MTDPTIPELVARLRELHNARRYPTEMLVATIRDDQSAQVYATSTGPMRVVRPVAETTVTHADLIAETLNALPTLLDALERGQGQTWRPIETAPRDGTEVALLFAREETGVIGARSTWPRVRAGARFAGGDWSIPYYANNPPIGWTPLPAPPAAEGGEGG